MSPSTNQALQSTAATAVRSTFWSFLSFLSGRVLTFVTTIVLAALLTPTEFGVVAYCMVAMAYLELLNNFGIGQALVTRRDRVQEAANAAFWVGLGSSTLLFGIGWIAAPFIAQFFRTPEIVPMFRVLALILLLGGISTVPMALIQRDLRFKAYLLPSVGRDIVRGAVGIGLALAGYGPWALIWSEVVSRAIEAAGAWLLVRWRPTAAFDATIMRSMLAFGSHMILIALIGTLMANVDYLLVGRILGSAALAYYMLAYRLPEIVIRNTNDVVARVAFPLMAQMQSDREHLRQTYFGYLRSISLFAFPAGVGLALVTAPFIQIFYPPAWQSAIRPMQVISIQMAIASISYVPGIIYKAINRPEILTRLALLKLPVIVIVLWYGTRWGIDGVAGSGLALAIASSVLDCAVVQRVLGFAWGDLYRSLAPSAICAALMGLVVLGFNRLVPTGGILEIVLSILLGAATYILGLLLLSRETVVQAQTALRAAISRP
jgi:O-antigen/teichoic acid export membrane protein